VRGIGYMLDTADGQNTESAESTGM